MRPLRRLSLKHFFFFFSIFVENFQFCITIRCKMDRCERFMITWRSEITKISKIHQATFLFLSFFVIHKVALVFFHIYVYMYWFFLVYMFSFFCLFIFPIISVVVILFTLIYFCSSKGCFQSSVLLSQSIYNTTVIMSCSTSQIANILLIL